MIVDLGCQATVALTQKIVAALPGALLSISLLAGLAALGRLTTKRAGILASDILCGWALVAAFLTAVSVSMPQPLALAALMVFAAMAAAIFIAVRQKYFATPFWLMMFFPGLVILIAINTAGIAKWDDFSHWVPNALYIYNYDGVPGAALPPPHSAWPGYPYALPFLTYLTSQLAGGFLLQGGAMMNFLMLASFASLLTQIPNRRVTNKTSLSGIGFLAFALLFVTFLNPNFNASFTMTSQGDTSTMVAVGVLGFLLWNLLEAFRQKDQTSSRNLFIQITCIAVLLVLIKQSNLVLLGLLLIAFLVLCWKNKQLKQACIYAAAPLLIACLFRSLWQHHVDTQIAGNGFRVQPLSAWRFDLLMPLLKSMGAEALKKSGCFGLMLATIIYGAISLFRPSNRMRDYAILAGGTSLAFLFFLTLCYLGTSFSEIEIRRAASFYRYCTQLGLLNLTFLWLAAPGIYAWVKAKTNLQLPQISTGAKIAASLFVLCALPLVLRLCPSCLIAQPSEEICAYRHQAEDIVSQLPDHAHLAIVEPETDGMFTFVVNFEMAMEEARSNRTASTLWSVNQFNTATLPAHMTELEADKSIDAVYVQKAKQAPLQILGLSNQATPVFFVRDDGGWKQLSP